LPLTTLGQETRWAYTTTLPSPHGATEVRIGRELSGLTPHIPRTDYRYFAFSALTLLVGWQEGHPACKKTEWWGAGVVICLAQGTDLHMA